MSHECEECGEEFDTERGLHIHQSQSHEEENEKQETEQESSKNNNEQSEQASSGITLTTKQFGRLTFATGLFLGIVVGMMSGGFSGLSGNIQAPTGDANEKNNDGSPSESNVVKLSSAEYPYGDLEAGVGSGEKTYGDTTFKLDGEPYIGSPSADVTAVSYEDFQCPFCKRYNEGAYTQIVENYVRTGDVQYFYKNLPLPQLGHDWAEPSALASECALNQDEEAFWTFKQGFFSNKDKLTKAYNSGSFDESMYRWAEQTGLNKEKFKQCYDNEEEMDEVNQDKQEAGENNAQATPTILINDQKVEGAQPYSRFESTIESALQ